MKTVNILRTLAGALLITGACIVSCKKDPPPPPPPPPPAKGCNTLARVKLMDCNTGQKMYMLELVDDKTLIEPYGIPAGFPLRENMCVKIGYQLTKPVSRCNGMTAQITCIMEVPCPDPAEPCDVMVKVIRDGSIEGCKLLFERMDDHRLLEPVAGFNSVDDFQQGQLLLIGYKEVHLGRVSYCMVPTIQITCKRSANSTGN